MPFHRHGRQCIKNTGAAEKLRVRLKALMNLAIDLGWRRDNPVPWTKLLKARSPVLHAWTEKEIAAYYKVHQPGTLAHTAMTLMLYTGASIADAVKLGWSNIEGNRLQYRRGKTDDTRSVLCVIPLHPALRDVLDGCPRSATTFLETEQGTIRSPKSLGNSMRAWCDAAGLSRCTSQGLRKAFARRFAESGASPAELMAALGIKG